MSLAESRQTRTAVVLAVVFLAVIGAGAGVALGSAGTGTDAASPQITVTPSSPDGSRSADPEPSGGPASPSASVSRSVTPKHSTKTYPPPSRTACPGQIIEAAGRAGAHGELKLRLYVKTGKSEVWICMDGKHKLFYQGHLLGKPFPAGTSDTTLFLTDVEPRDHDYLAIYEQNGHATKYYVSMNGITVEDHNGEETTQKAVDCYTP